MFRLSRGAEYSIRGILYLSLKYAEKYAEENISIIEEISQASEVPVPYMAKLFQALARKGFVKSFKGQKGGFVLSKHPRDISMLDVIEAMEGPVHLNVCLIHDGFCPRDLTCSVHDVWTEAQKRLFDYLKECNFEQLALNAQKKHKAYTERVAVSMQ